MLTTSLTTGTGRYDGQRPDKNRKLFQSRVRRFVPTQRFLRSELERVYTKFKDIDDELQRQGDDRLFLKEMDSAHQRALRLVDAGLLSDPANFDMYFYTRTVNGCPEYTTCRGTSQLENYWRTQERQATCNASLGNIN